ETNGWIRVRLAGPPAEVGFQHGYLLAPEIRDAQHLIAFLLQRDTQRDWKFFREAAREMMWPKVPEEYREELRGISDGLAARGVKLDAFDLAAMNAWQELSPYWFKWREAQQGRVARVTAPEHCSAFVATGSYTKDGRPVMGHNAWTGYAEGARWNIVFDIRPSAGNRILMDGFPGLIHSADDFGVNSAGIMITETTISQFNGFDPAGVPEFVRARRAMQYAASIDDFARLMREGNNGGYANNWLVADRKTGEIASLELGLKNTTLQRKTDGYFAGSNLPENGKLVKEETTFPVHDMALSATARHARWLQLLEENKGRIDIAAGQRFLSDHYDTFDKKTAPSERTLCGHVDLSPRGIKPWQDEYGPAGAVQAKVTDAAMAGRMAFTAAMGHSCGINFKAAEHLKAHPTFAWQKDFLRDLDAHPWTEFHAAE
ncbi:MAG TPA: C45 family peptidase, partial [Bryobacteraceae bacterium]|nr:C45 family peptidase [Bryobacteraceae bacterium]